MLYLGIDYGTCNIKTALYDSNLKLKFHGVIEGIKKMNLSNEQGSDVLPHIAYIGKEKIVLSNRQQSPRSYFAVSGIKRHFEEKEWKTYVPTRNREMSAMEIAQEEFKWIRDRFVENYGEPPEKVILTVPVSFSELQKKRIKISAENAGLSVSNIVTEPFASIFTQYQLFSEEIKKTSCMLVFDFGGGTLDMSIFRIKPPSENENLPLIETLSSTGINFGGNNITGLIRKKLIEDQHSDKLNEIINNKFRQNFLDDTNIPDSDKVVDSENYNRNFEAVRNKILNILDKDINTFKEEICNDVTYDDDYDPHDFIPEHLIDLGDLGITLSYTELEEIISSSGINEKICESLDNLINQAEILANDVKKIMLIGGTSKIPCFRNVLKNYFNDTIAEERKNFEEEYQDFFDSSESEEWDSEPFEFLELNNDDKFNAVALGATIYLRYNNDAFRTLNRLSYEIGTLQDGEYKRLKTLSDICGEWTIRDTVKPEKTDDGRLCVKLYQVFNSSEDDVMPENLVYMGYFELDSSVYSGDKYYSMRIMVDNNGTVYGEFYEFQRGMDNASPITEPLTITLEV